MEINYFIRDHMLILDNKHTYRNTNTVGSSQWNNTHTKNTQKTVCSLQVLTVSSRQMFCVRFEQLWHVHNNHKYPEKPAQTRIIIMHIGA